MQIQQTQDYTLFKRIAGNRKVNKPHINRLLEAIKEDPETITYNPLIVDEEFRIVDGQHRLEAIKQLNLPVYFIQAKGLTLKTVQRLNSISKMWSPMDYAKSFAENGDMNYQIYIDFKDEFKLNHDILMRYMTDGHPMTGTMFKNGKFKVYKTRKAWEYCSQLKNISQFYERAGMRNFAFGYYIVIRSDNYDHDRMMAQMKKYGHLFNEQALANDYARELERIYNFKQRDRVRLF